MVKMPSMGEISKRWTDAIPRVSARYKSGVQGTTDWQEKAAAGQSNFVERMSDSAVLARRESGIRKVSNAEWQNKAADLGAKRIGPGMNAAKEKYSKGYTPHQSALSGLTLPDKTTDSMANIDARLKLVVKTLQDTKAAQLA